MDAAGQEAFWIRKKQLAIQGEVRQFYSQYAGQSWKNMISIGDSDFERKATHKTMDEYKVGFEAGVYIHHDPNQLVLLS